MKKIIIAIVAAASLCACSPRLVILHLNDTHSHHEAMLQDGNPTRGGIVERGALVDSIRAAEGEKHVLLLHAGDFNQGSSYYTRYGGQMEVDIVNAFGYDCITLGNHEFDNGVDDLAARLAKIECPVICANINVDGTPLEPYVKPYAIIKRGGYKIGIVGITSNLRTNVSAAVSAALRQPNDLEVVNKWAEYLRKTEKCDLIILLSHAGYKEDCDIVAQTHDIDLCIGGHSHTYLDDFTWVKNADGKDVPVCQDWCWGYNIGKVTVKGRL